MNKTPTLFRHLSGSWESLSIACLYVVSYIWATECEALVEWERRGETELHPHRLQLPTFVTERTGINKRWYSHQEKRISVIESSQLQGVNGKREKIRKRCKLKMGVKAKRHKTNGRKTCPISTLFTTNTILIGFGLNQLLRCEKSDQRNINTFLSFKVIKIRHLYSL